MYNKLQYISQGESVEEQLLNIHQALDNGCDWIQMRFKHQKQKKSHAVFFQRYKNLRTPLFLSRPHRF